MKKHSLPGLLFFCALFLNLPAVKAQYITIPDTGFVSYIMTSTVAHCLVGNQLDTNCTRTTIDTIRGAELDMSHRNMSDLTGLEHLSFYSSLAQSGFSVPVILSHNNFSAYPVQLGTISGLGSHGDDIDLSYNHIDSVRLNYTQQNLSALDLSHNGMTYFNYDSGFRATYFSFLAYVYLDYNNLDTLMPELGMASGGGSPPVNLHVRHNQLRNIPRAFTFSMSSLDCGANQIQNLTVTNNYSMDTIICDSNRITSLSVSAQNVRIILNCSYNNISSFTVSNSYYSGQPVPMWYLICNNNSLTSLPPAAHVSQYLDCRNNPYLTCLNPLPFVDSFWLYIDSTSVSCLPNRYATCIYRGSTNVNTLPICNYALSGCAPYHTAEGYLYSDTNANCIKDPGETALDYIGVSFFRNGVFSQKIYSDAQGFYGFTISDTGFYSLALDDTTSFYSCMSNGGNTIHIGSTDTTPVRVDFGLRCRPGFDVGTAGIYEPFIRYEAATIVIGTGDLSHLSGMDCASGLSGTVSLIIDGAASYVGPSPGSLAPTSVSGDTIFWNVSNFDSISPYHSLNVQLIADSSAPFGTQICLTMVVTPTAGDLNLSNNVYTQCGVILSSHDPNEKSVSPAGPIPATQDWLTYTIDFQNTGNDTAFNIYVMDTLDAAHVNVSSFQYLGGSAYCVPQVLEGGIARFSFPDIKLVDSMHDEPKSHGWLLYRIRPLPNMAPGTQITNTSSVYFDQNAPVRTDTTISIIQSPTGISHTEALSFDAALYPDPASQFCNVSVLNAGSETYSAILLDISGREVSNIGQLKNGTLTFPVSGLAKGIYMLKVNSGAGQALTKKLVVE